ncbi:MAG: AMP-binding protein [Lachnospiraceae bacterium]|nr:AMP-binding protein [Lachnospiraceae bacterium]
MDGYLFTDNEVISVFPSLVEIAEEPVITDPDAPRIVVLSSGTTGKTDGIVLSERNVLKNLYSILKFYYFSPGERLLHVLPYWHMFGLMGDLFMAACCGAAICLPVSGAGVLKAMRDFKPEIINMPPAMADMLCELIGKEGDVSAVTGGCLRRVMCAGAHLNEKTSDRLLGYGIKPLTAYGMTECSPCISVMPEGKLVRGTSGVLLDCWEIRLSDGNEILLRGDCVMLGYIDEAATKERIRDGWFHTGDIGSIDEEGYLTVSGRVNSLLVFSNGVKCFPERAEEKINLLPFILESRVAKVTDRIGDHPKLIIHTENEAGINREEVDRIMKEFRVFPYETEYTDSALPRNRLGKMIRE